MIEILYMTLLENQHKKKIKYMKKPKSIILIYIVKKIKIYHIYILTKIF